MGKYTYEVWALGFDKNNMATDEEVLLGEYTDKQEAIHIAEQYNDISEIEAKLEGPVEEGACFEVVVEKCIDTECVDDVYSNYIYK